MLALAFATLSLRAQVAVSPTGWIKPQFLDSNANPVASGCLFSYQAGTTTPQATYTDSSGTAQNTNPVILDAGGFPSGGSGIWLIQASYKFVLKSFGGTNCAAGSTLWTMDNIPGPSSSAVYSTISSNAVAQTHRSILNWVNGTGTTASCSDNSFLLSTDCHIDLSGSAVTGTSLTAGQLIVGNSGSTVQTGDLTGDVSTSGSTATTIGLQAVTTAKLADTAVTTAKIAAANVTEPLFGFTDITTANVSSSKHGLMPKLDGNANHVLNQSGTVTNIGIDQYANGGGCSTANTAYATCTVTVNWPIAFADTSYFPTCTLSGTITGFPYLVAITTIATGSVTVTISNGTSSGAAISGTSAIVCHGHHN